MKTLLLDPFRVKPFADQPRKRFRDIPQLAASIRLAGQVTPIVVTTCRTYLRETMPKNDHRRQEG